MVTWAVPAAISAAGEDAGRDDAAAGEAGEAEEAEEAEKAEKVGEVETEQHPQYWDTNPA